MITTGEFIAVVIATIPLIIGEFHVTPIREALKRLEEAVLRLLRRLETGTREDPEAEDIPDPQGASKDALRQVDRYRSWNRFGFIAVVVLSTFLFVHHKMEEQRVGHVIEAWLRQAAVGQPNGQIPGVPLEEICEALPREYPMHLIVRAIENSEVIKKVRFDLCPGTAANGVTVPVGKQIWLYSL